MELEVVRNLKFFKQPENSLCLRVLELVSSSDIRAQGGWTGHLDGGVLA